MPAPKPGSVTLLVLTLNEAEGMKAIMPRIDRGWVEQIIVVDGGSTDGTVDWARENGFDVLEQQRKGIRFAYFEVFPRIRGEYIITFSPDGNCPPEAIPQIASELRKGYDLVIGSRYLPPARSYDDDAWTAFGNWLFTRTVNLLYGARYTDVMVIMRGYRTALVEELDLLNNKAYELPERLFGTVISWEPLMAVRAAKAGVRIGEIPVPEPARIAGERKLQLWRWGAAYYSQFWIERFIWLGRAPAASRTAASGEAPRRE